MKELAEFISEINGFSLFLSKNNNKSYKPKSKLTSSIIVCMLVLIFVASIIGEIVIIKLMIEQTKNQYTFALLLGVVVILIVIIYEIIKQFQLNYEIYRIKKQIKNNSK